MMNESQAISSFAALAQETRLAILRFLVKAGEAGMASGDLAATIGVSASSMSFHLGQLENTGMIRSQRHSRKIMYRADYEQLGALINFLMNDCCANDPRVVKCC
jgi:ArsR family transcriptional regulator, arsenate/arsenite/antimonite-responsive transcriptional repressor